MLDNALSPLENHLVEWIDQLAAGQNPLGHVAEEKIQEIHSIAFWLYHEKHYQEAGHFFRLLVVSRPSEPKYWKGFGACLQMQKNYEEAINCYMSAQILKGKQTDPYLYVHVADCYFALKQADAGWKALGAAYLRAKATNDRRVLQHVALMRDIWSKKN